MSQRTITSGRTDKESAPVVLYVEKMRKVRQGQKRKITIDIPSFEVTQGDFVAVVGENGSGKSTLLDMLGLILSPDKIHVFKFMTKRGQYSDLSRLSKKVRNEIRRNHIAYVLQKGGLLEFLTIKQNIDFAAQLNRRKIARISQQAVIKRLGIESILAMRPGKLSGGQRQKAAIACALVQQPDVILADEPTASLDSQSAKRLMKTFSYLTRKAKVVLIMVTHDKQLVSNNANRFYHFITREYELGQITSRLYKGLPLVIDQG